MVKVKIIYGTGGGNTEITCERVKEIIETGENFVVDLIRAKTAVPEDMLGADLLILASPTYGHGLLENFMAKYIGAAKGIDLKQTKAAVIGLGNSLYDDDYFIESEKILYNFLENHNANIVVDSLKIAKSPLPYLKNIVEEWSDTLLSKI
jgi:flavodoxin